jgi:hypothetical protein
MSPLARTRSRRDIARRPDQSSQRRMIVEFASMACELFRRAIARASIAPQLLGSLA